jgi:hypothetical protein
MNEHPSNQHLSRLSIGSAMSVSHDRPPDFFNDLRDDGISETSKAVHPAGNPISHSTHSGFREPPERRAIVSRLGLSGPTRPAAPPLFDPYDVAAGVGSR